MNLKKLKEKSKAQVEKIFKEKLFPMIKHQTAAGGKALELRLEMAKEIEIYQQKVEAALLSCHELQALLDKQVLEAMDTRKTLREVETRSAELKTFERHLEHLAAQDLEAEAAQKDAEKALAEAIRRGLLDLREDIEDLTRCALTEALAALVYFEERGIAACKDLGVDLGSDFDKDFGRFLALDSKLKELGYYCSPIGRGTSFVKRRRLMREFLAEAE
jgi:hypothetical protein